MDFSFHLEFLQNSQNYIRPCIRAYFKLEFISRLGLESSQVKPQVYRLDQALVGLSLNFSGPEPSGTTLWLGSSIPLQS